MATLENRNMRYIADYPGGGSIVDTSRWKKLVTNKGIKDALKPIKEKPQQSRGTRR